MKNLAKTIAPFLLSDLCPLVSKPIPSQLARSALKQTAVVWSDCRPADGNASCSLRHIGPSSFVPCLCAAYTLCNICLLHSCCVIALILIIDCF